MPAPRGRSKSANKKPSPLEIVKEDISQKQQRIDELKKQIQELKDSIEQQSLEEKRLGGKLHIILPEIIAHRDRELFPVEPVDDIVDIDAGYVRSMVQQMIDDLRGRQASKSLIEERLEDLEQRIVVQNRDYQSIMRKNISCMQGIDDALKCNSVHEMRYIIRKLKQELLIEEPIKGPNTSKSSDGELHSPVRNGHLFDLTQLPPHELESPFSDPLTNYLQSMETVRVSIPRPVRKYGGETHIKKMLPELRDAVCKELNEGRAHRGDWRHFAHLVGISTETIQFWRRLELDDPMDHVLNFWKDEQNAFVVVLHRLLMSPQVKAFKLAQIISEFYNVD